MQSFEHALRPLQLQVEAEVLSKMLAHHGQWLALGDQAKNVFSENISNPAKADRSSGWVAWSLVRFWIFDCVNLMLAENGSKLV